MCGPVLALAKAGFFVYGLRMKVKLLRPVLYRGQEHKAGEVLECDQESAWAYIGALRAMRYVEAPQIEAPKIEPETIQTREPVVESRDPKPKRGKK